MGWKAFHTSCYYLSNDIKPWGESKKNCTGMGSYLVVINTEAEHIFCLYLIDWPWWEERRKAEGKREGAVLGIQSQPWVGPSKTWTCSGVRVGNSVFIFIAVWSSLDACTASKYPNPARGAASFCQLSPCSC